MYTYRYMIGKPKYIVTFNEYIGCSWYYMMYTYCCIICKLHCIMCFNHYSRCSWYYILYLCCYIKGIRHCIPCFGLCDGMSLLPYIGFLHGVMSVRGLIVKRCRHAVCKCIFTVSMNPLIVSAVIMLNANATLT